MINGFIMNLYKFFTFGIFIFFPMYGCVLNDNITYLNYDKCNNLIWIINGSSAKYFKKIELDMQQDTLLITNVSKKMVPLFGRISARNAAQIIIKLQSNVEFVKLEGTLYKISDINEYSQEKFIEQRTLFLTVYPKKFPCVIQ